MIVTGAANGIGKGIAICYAEQGAKVVIADVNKAEGQKVVMDIQQAVGEALFQLTDIRK